jgi:hypothetical protein
MHDYTYNDIQVSQMQALNPHRAVPVCPGDTDTASERVVLGGQVKAMPGAFPSWCRQLGGWEYLSTSQGSRSAYLYSHTQ